MGGDSMNWVQTLPTPRLFRVNLEDYQLDIDWVKKFMAGHGYVITRALLDPYIEVWFFYERNGDFVVALDHAYIETLMEARLKGQTPDPSPVLMTKPPDYDWSKCGWQGESDERDGPVEPLP